MKTFDVALIGIGNWGTILKRYFEADDRFFLKHICDSKSDLDVVFKNPDIDVIAIATPDETHADLVLEALNHNKHVFCEKPLALLHLQASLIKTLAREKKRVVVTDYIYTFSKGLKKVQELIGTEEIGSLKKIVLVSRQLGDITQDVYWVLGSHMLSVLNMFIPIEEYQFDCERIVNNRNQIHTVSFWSNKEPRMYVDVSLSDKKKIRRMFFTCDDATITFHPISGKIEIIYDYEIDTIEYDESQNIRLALDKMYACLVGDDIDNLDSACLITKVLNELEV